MICVRFKFAILLTSQVALGGCDLNPCENEVLERVAAPSGKLEAVTFARECGATVGFNTQVSVVVAGATPQESGNVLILDGRVRLRATWLSADSLQILGVASARPYKQEYRIEGVSVAYSK